MERSSSQTNASLRWKILRKSLLSRSSWESCTDRSIDDGKIVNISRKGASGFNLIKFELLDANFVQSKGEDILDRKDTCVRYKFPLGIDSELTFIQRRDECVELNDFEISTKYNIDTTGLVCRWPSEDVLAYFCLTHTDLFRSKRVMELGAGYGLAGFAVAAFTDATEVVISDGNPQVVDYIQRNMRINGGQFGDTKVRPMILHWNQEQDLDMLNSFDIIVASDCTFFKEFHESLVHTVKLLLKNKKSEAIFLSPRRGDSLIKFLEKVKENGLKYALIENYDGFVWSLHQSFVSGNDVSWPNYDPDHCYPLLVRITFV